MIRLLPKSVSNHLRSGVAITSVSQCVEELVLNSLDAGATCVAVRVDLSCFKIQVVDNGTGIQPDQLELVGSRHCTSKCNTLEDLDSLGYYGFRGEALASICDISAIVEIVSRTKYSSKTFCKLIHDDKSCPVNESKLHRPAVGTTVTVHDLFHKLPVRKKTVNQNLELEQVRHCLEAIALTHTDISISLRNDENGNKIMQTHKCSSTVGTFRQLFGAVKAKTLKEVKNTKDNFQLSGFISCEGHFSKTLQFVYVNNRLVLKTKIHKLLNGTLKKLYSSRKKMTDFSTVTVHKSNPTLTSSPTKQTDKHGIFIVNITCPLNEYDITFDPTKTLIEFKDWDTVLQAVDGIVQDFLRQLNGMVSPVASGGIVDLEKKPANSENVSVTAQEQETTTPTEISTTTRGCSLHSRMVKRSEVRAKLCVSDVQPSSSCADEVKISQGIIAEEETLREGRGKTDERIIEFDAKKYDAEPLNDDVEFVNTQDAVEEMVNALEESANVEIARIGSSDVLSNQSECDCSRNMCNCKDLIIFDEDPLCSPSTLHQTSAESKTLTEANDSGIDTEMPNTDNWEYNTSRRPIVSKLGKKLVMSHFRQPLSRLSVLRKKDFLSEQESKCTERVREKLSQLRESVCKPGTSAQSSGNRERNSFLSSSLQNLRETVGSVFVTDVKNGAKPEKNTNVRIGFQESSSQEVNCEVFSVSKRKSTEIKSTTSAKLARLAGLARSEKASFKTSPDVQMSINALAADNKIKTKTDVTTESNSCLLISEEHCNQDYVLDTDGNDIVKTSAENVSGVHKQDITRLSKETFSREESSEFLTTETLITPFIPVTREDHYGRADGRSLSYEKCLRMDVGTSFELSFKLDQGDALTSASESTISVVPMAEDISSPVPDKNTACAKSETLIFTSPEGKIRLSQDNRNPISASDVFIGYTSGVLDHNTVSDSQHSKTSHDTVPDSPSTSENAKVMPSPEESGNTSVEASQGFDFKFLRPIPNLPLKSGHCLMTSTLGCSDKGVENLHCISTSLSSPGSCNDTSVDNETGSLIFSPVKDLVDLLVTPSPVHQVSEPDHEPMEEYITPGSLIILNSEKTLLTDKSLSPLLTSSPDQLATSRDNTSVDNSTCDELTGSYIQTAVPAHVAITIACRQDYIPENTSVTDTDVNVLCTPIPSGTNDDVVHQNQVKSDEVMKAELTDGILEPKWFDGENEGIIFDPSKKDGGKNVVQDSLVCSGCEKPEQLQRPGLEKELCEVMPTEDDDKRSDVDVTQHMVLQRHEPLSGKKIFVHPVTGHTMDESAWEEWREQAAAPQEQSSQLPQKRKKLLCHDLAYQLCKQNTSLRAERNKISSKSSFQDEMDNLWSDHVIGQSAEGLVKWRNYSDRDKITAPLETSDNMTDLFEDWENPVFSLPEQEITTAQLPVQERTTVKVQKVLQPCKFTSDMLEDAKVLGQVDDKFIACLMKSDDKNLASGIFHLCGNVPVLWVEESREKPVKPPRPEGDLLVIVDQHAAHERIRLEQLTEDAFTTYDNGLKAIKRSAVVPPLELLLTEETVRVMTAYQAKFETMGLEFISSERRDGVLIKSAPSCFVEREANEIKKGRNSIIREILEVFVKEQVELLQATHGGTATIPVAIHKLLCSRACHGAIKFGDSLSREECEEVVDSLSQCDLPFQCAHGRPSVIPLLDLNKFRTKYPEKKPSKPKLWKLQRQMSEINISNSKGV